MPRASDVTPSATPRGTGRPRASIKFRLIGSFMLLITVPLVITASIGMKLLLNRLEDERLLLGEQALDEARLFLVQQLARAERAAQFTASADMVRLAMRNGQLPESLDALRVAWQLPIIEVWSAERTLVARSSIQEQGIEDWFTDEEDESLTRALDLEIRSDYVTTPAGPAIRAAVPIVDMRALRAGGACVVTLPLDVSFLQHMKKAVDGEVALLWRPDGAMVSSFLDAEGLPLSKLWPDSPARMDQSAPAGPEHTREIIAGAPYATAYAVLREAGGRIVGVLSTALPMAGLEASKRDTLAFLAVSTGIMLGLAALLGLFTSFMVTRPLDSLLAAIRGLAEGRLDARAPVGRGDEFGQLAEAFNLMADSLAEKQEKIVRYSNLLEDINTQLGRFNSELERMVEERTAELSNSNEKLLRAHATMRAVFDSIPGTMNVVDREFVVLDVSDQTLADFGSKERGHFIGRKCYESYHGRTSPCPWCSVPAALATGRTVRRVSEPAPGGAPGSAAMIYSTPMRDSTGRILGVVEFVLDISELKAMERELKAAKEEAESASRAKSDFLASMSHEIRTPLNAILGMADMLAETGLDEEQRRYLEVFRTASSDLLGLIGGILDLSRIEAGQLDLAQAPFSPAELTAAVCRVLGVKASPHGVSLECRVHPDTPPVAVGDAARLRQVLVNLVGNAVKFTHAGGVHVEVAPEPAEEGSDVSIWLRMDVVDTGIGIPREKIEHIFERFTQVDGSVTRRYGGSGLGLFIVKRLVELMGGRLSVESSPGEGSAFSVLVPLGLPAEDEARNAARPVRRRTDRYPALPAMPSDASKHSAPPRILLVDDSAQNRFVVRAFLKGCPCVLEEADNGALALERVSSREYDLVLMDIQMPVMDGYTATREIRAMEEATGRPRTTVLAMTAYALREDEQRCLDAGCDGYLAKPLRKSAFLETVRGLAPEARCDAERRAPTANDSAALVNGVDPEVAHVAPRYLTSLRRALAETQDALTRGLIESAHTFGHQLKGEAPAFGFPQLGRIGAALQAACEADARDEAARLLAEVQATLEHHAGEQSTRGADTLRN